MEILSQRKKKSSLIGLVFSVAFLLVCFIMLFSACQPVSHLNSYLSLPDDNPAEEALEFGLKHGLDIDSDLTGSSPE